MMAQSEQRRRSAASRSVQGIKIALPNGAVLGYSSAKMRMTARRLAI